MRKILAGLVSGIALLGLAACDDGADPAAQGIDGAPAEQSADPSAADPATPAPDNGTAQ
ncbi:hypothetical protein [Chelativorans sp. YIM 93263]|uniref:hypothetical protein n=1 Tax=Chelativorans sp. YIM 93263 TaxID=2906648 RepID=UPI002378C93A|nr:hypothetical protein [Chelativorans sp. YIM 93263]